MTGSGPAVVLCDFPQQGLSPYLQSSAHPCGDGDHMTRGLGSDSVGTPREDPTFESIRIGNLVCLKTMPG